MKSKIVKIKAIKIDVDKQQVYPIEIEKSISNYYPHIGNGTECTTFCCPVKFDNGDFLLADDEGLYHTINGAFKMNDWQYPIVGNCIILGSDDEGESQDYKSSIEDINKQITWFSPNQLFTYATE